MAKFTYLASVIDGKISFPAGVLDKSMLSMEVNDTSTNDTIPTSKAVYDSITKLASQNVTDKDGIVTIKADKYLVLPQVNQITSGGNYLQQGWYYQHFDISGLGTNEEIIAGTKNTVIFWLSDSKEQIVEDIQNPTYIEGFTSGFKVGWWLTGVNDGRFPYSDECHFEITEIDANKITTKLYAKYIWHINWWIDNWLRNGKVDLTGNLSKDDYTVYCNGATATTAQEKLAQTQCGGVTISNISLFVGGGNFFGSNKNITVGNSNYTTIGNTLTVGNNLINTTYSGTVLGSYNEPNGGVLQVGGGKDEASRKTLFSVHSDGGDGKIKLNAPTEVYKNFYVKDSNGDTILNIQSSDGSIYTKSTLASSQLKDTTNDKVVIARKGDGGLIKSNITSSELNCLQGVTSNLQSQINDISEGKGVYKNSSNLSKGQVEAKLKFTDNLDTFVPTTDISDVSIKIMALNAAKTNIEKYNVKFMAYKNGEEIIATNPLCESVVSNGIQLIDSVDVKLNTEKTGIEVSVKTKQEQVTLKYSISISQF